MRYTIAASLIVAATAVSAAQTSSVPQTAPAKSLTVTGCLSPGADENTFTLTASAAKLGAVGTTGSMESTASANQKPDTRTIVYTLAPTATVDLSAHVGHTVEITGVEPPAGSSVEQPSSMDESAAKMGIVAKRLTVNAVKQISGDCHMEEK